MAKYLSEGKRVNLDVAANGAALERGQFVAKGKVLLHVDEDIGKGGKGTGTLCGRYEVKKSGAAWADGAYLNWDASTQSFTVSAASGVGDLEQCAIADGARTAGATEGVVILTPGSAA